MKIPARPALLGLACAAALNLVAGVSSAAKPPKDVFETSYRDPDAQPMHVRGVKVVAAVMIKDPKARQRAEDTLAKEITKLGGQGVPMYSISDENAPTKEGESKTRARVEAVGAKGLVVMRPVDVNHATAATLSNSSNDMYGGYWGGYYGIGWADPWIEKAPDTRVDLVITVETLVFSLPQNKLVWTGTSQTTNPKNAEKLVHQLAIEGTQELKRQGLLVP
ncbi:MAG TPA: hypothetical protein VGQ27_06475 [Steroidobacteraceae bacterium]|jgi:hypothetical protein|nr:hypothetical protein [Steroidobacteraceae bacterium]